VAQFQLTTLAGEALPTAEVKVSGLMVHHSGDETLKKKSAMTPMPVG
jgi:hypothetical protein